MSTKKIITLLSICTLTVFNTAKAQFDSLYHSINGENFLLSQNAALLSGINISSTSNAELKAEASKGGFKNYSEGDKTFSAGIKAESFYRFNEKVSSYGKIEYESFAGKNMTGAAFSDPENSPFNIIEQADTNAGIKRRETYNIIGGLSVKTWKKLFLGAKFNYQTANNAKRKDLRCQNSLMDLTASFGISYDFEKFQLGGAYIYRRRNESMKFSVKGTSDKIYNSIISYGNFFGIREEFGEDGFTDKSKELPLFDLWHGGEFHVLIHLTDNLQWLNELEVFSRKGHYGTKGQYTVELSQHEADITTLKGSLFLKNNRLIQSINYALTDEKLYNFLNIYNFESFEGGLTNYVYYDKLKTSGKNPQKISANYSAVYFYGADILSFKTGAEFSSRNTFAVKYPFWRRQEIKTKEFFVEIGHENGFLSGRLSKILCLQMQKGSGTPYEDGCVEKPAEGFIKPATQNDFLMQEYEYLCKPHFRISAELKYTEKIFSNKLDGYIAANYAFTSAKNTNYLDGKRHFVSIRTGIVF
ncbi:MAG: hypothetical protein IIT56_05425 [Bacteroidales bacterium]|nr:hypothetical protein [Bacteroidales bacterium]